ncbi:hypothetical protein PF005_g21993 [Phytophthora fragariae]|uniref:Reverse transcriptase domain-containing protein n=1 Tax=Phytophthora fragariae TaxID=53985 RepID=A0A6A3IIW8_9STRA|nr:hypothetical protein PF011_g21781 [Phytophthora fragariae]KAE9183669.1 hypothetical protein PF005_g21993 [Phytophthora fragariae]KAE9190449.1 hypothetical protein PF002_g24766 [Phytophthora fragariae]
MAASKCNPIKNIAEVGARDVQTVADETCPDLAPSTDEKGSRSATAGVESPVCDNAGPVCVTKNLVNQIDDQDRHDETGANQASGPDRRGGTRPNLGRNQCRTLDMGDEVGRPSGVDEQVGVVQRGDPHAWDAEAQQTQLPEATATDKEIKTEEAGVTDKQVKTEEAGATDKEMPAISTPKTKDRQVAKDHLAPTTSTDRQRECLATSGKGGICDIDVGNAKHVAQRVRKVASQFREKLSQLLKGLLSARIIQNSTSPWASPIVVIIKKKGVDIRLCISYRLTNSLTRLMVYPMPLINDLLDDLDKVLWYCSLDMASGFWNDRSGPDDLGIYHAFWIF